MNTIAHAQEVWLGLDKQGVNLTVLQVCLRAFIVFVAALVVVRTGGKRFRSHNTAFDAVLGFILASMLARAVNGSGAFWATIVAGFLLVGLHRLMAKMALHWHAFGNLVKGHANLVIKDGVVLREVLNQHDLTDHDVAEDLRMNGNVGSPEEVKLGYFERNGHVSVIKREK